MMFEWLLPWKRMPLRRSAFLEGREAMPDASLISQLPCDDPEIARMVVVIRRVLGRICSIDPEMIHPFDLLEHLQAIIDWGYKSGWLWNADYATFEPIGFRYHVEREFVDDFQPHIRKPYFGELPSFAGSISLRKSKTVQTFGEWACEAATVILEHLPKDWKNALIEPFE